MLGDLHRICIIISSKLRHYCVIIVSYLDTFMLGILDTRVLGHLDTWILGYLNTRVLGHFGNWILEYLDN